MNQPDTISDRQARFDISLDRHEAKYIIPGSLVPAIRQFIGPFCEPDPNAAGIPPEYLVTTLQLDSPDMSLHHARERELLNRFKLRARTYGEPGSSRVFLEIKRKIGHTIVKSRTAIPFDAWNGELIHKTKIDISFKTANEEIGFLEFIRLAREVGAEPRMLVRYTRESYRGRDDHYARISIDRNLLYQPTTSWNSWGKDGIWCRMDSTFAQDKMNPFSGVILELKVLNDVPRWMIDLVIEFELVRTGNCKYSTAVGLESFFGGMPDLSVDANELFCT